MRLLNISEEVDRLQPKSENKSNTGANIETANDRTAIVELKLSPTTWGGR